ncbi:MAG TPA: diguanylate cyclase [Novosphingobium sp.]|nr:diguanylate cyclase [Novosphingobium sp.]
MRPLQPFRVAIPFSTPSSVRDAYALAQYRSLSAQVPLGYAALMPIALSAMWIGAPGAPFWLRLGLPAGVCLFSLIRLIIWINRPASIEDPARARRMIASSGIISTILAGAGSVWCALNWVHAPPQTAAYFPLFMTMATLTPVFAQAMSAPSGYANLAAGLGPIVAMMVWRGDVQARLGAVLIVVSALFLVNMLWQQKRRFIDLLLLEQAMREEAKTDPLTGLVNRRALADHFLMMVSAAREGHAGTGQQGERRPSLIQIDLDGFKPINDAHGHATGDMVLREVADRLRREVGKGAMVCRMGGDEFAVLSMAPSAAGPQEAALGETQMQRLRRAMAMPFSIAGQPISIGASIGFAQWPQDGRSLEQLSATADRRLYGDKARRRIVPANMQAGAA